MTQRVYCNGKLTKEQRLKLMADKLNQGLVCTGYVVGGQGGILTKQKNDVAYFREGTPEDIAFCRAALAPASSSLTTSDTQTEST